MVGESTGREVGTGSLLWQAWNWRIQGDVLASLWHSVFSPGDLPSSHRSTEAEQGIAYTETDLYNTHTGIRANTGS